VEAAYFDSHVRAEHQESLHEKLQELVTPAVKAQLALLVTGLLQDFDKDFKCARVDRPSAFSASAEEAAAAALDAFDKGAADHCVPGTGNLGETAVVASCVVPGSMLQLYVL